MSVSTTSSSFVFEVQIPPNGGGYQSYKFDLRFSNRRPVLLGLQDQYVRPGRTLEIPLRAVDPEGFSVSFYKRAGEVGEIHGGFFSWKCPRKEAGGSKTVTIIATDGTSGNSYAGKEICQELQDHRKAEEPPRCQGSLALRDPLQAQGRRPA